MSDLDFLTSGLDCLICGLDRPVSGLDYLICWRAGGGILAAGGADSQDLPGAAAPSLQQGLHLS